jgi:HK97 family phage portal protein
MPNLIDRARAALKSFRFPGYPQSTQSFGAQVFWPEWPSQLNAVSLMPPDLTTSSLIMSAVNWAGTVFAEPIVQVLRQAEQDEWVPTKNHPLQRIWEQPNPYYSGAVMLKAFAYYWLVNGNVYLLKKRDKVGNLRELWLLDSDQVNPRWPVDGSEFISYYEIRSDGVPYQVAKGDIIHFRYGLDPRNHRIGLAPVRALLDEVMSDEAAIYYSKNILGKGGIPPYFLWPKANSDSIYTIDQAKVKEALMSSTSGANAGTPGVFSAPMEIGQVGFTPQQMSLKETHDTPEERLCAVLGIPALVLGFGFDDHATYSNYKTALQAAWQTFVIPTLKLFATQLTLQLLPEYTYRAGEWVQFDTSEISALEEDEKGVAEREVMKWSAGLVTRNEARAAMGMQPIDGEGGDEINTQPMSGASFGQSKALDEVKQFGRPYSPVQKDEDEIRAWWKANAPEEARTLLDAEVVN